MGDPAKNSSAGTSSLDAAVHLFFFFKELILLTFLLGKKKKRKGEKEMIQLEMKIMVPSGGRCWIRQEGGELQSSHGGREGVWGVRGSLAKSASVMREEQGHKGKQPQSDDGACPGLCTTDRNNVHLSWEDRPPQITLHSSPTHTVIPDNATEHYSEPLEQ